MQKFIIGSFFGYVQCDIDVQETLSLYVAIFLRLANFSILTQAKNDGNSNDF